MNTHRGQTVEYIVRKTGYSICELARSLNVNRRSVYNWFTQKTLKPDVIYRIGHVIIHDFSKEFPDLFNTEEFNEVRPAPRAKKEPDSDGAEIDLWKQKYISLLEQYNSALLQYQVDNN